MSFRSQARNQEPRPEAQLESGKGVMGRRLELRLWAPSADEQRNYPPVLPLHLSGPDLRGLRLFQQGGPAGLHFLLPRLEGSLPTCRTDAHPVRRPPNIRVYP